LTAAGAWGGAEDEALGRRGRRGQLGAAVLGVRGAPRGSAALQLPRRSHGRSMAGRGRCWRGSTALARTKVLGVVGFGEGARAGLGGVRARRCGERGWAR
jgi:hypothetical protein